MAKFSTFCSVSLHGDTDRMLYSNFEKCCRGKIVRNLGLPAWQKNFSLPLKVSLLLRSCPKSARATPNNVLDHSAPDFIQIGSLSAELWPNAWTRVFTPCNAILQSGNLRINGICYVTVFLPRAVIPTGTYRLFKPTIIIGLGPICSRLPVWLGMDSRKQ